MYLYTHLSTQCAAVMAQFSFSSAAPHLCKYVDVRHCRSDICQGHRPNAAFDPPTMRGSGNMRRPHTAITRRVEFNIGIIIVSMVIISKSLDTMQSWANTHTHQNKSIWMHRWAKWQDSSDDQQSYKRVLRLSATKQAKICCDENLFIAREKRVGLLHLPDAFQLSWARMNMTEWWAQHTQTV